MGKIGERGGKRLEKKGAGKRRLLEFCLRDKQIDGDDLIWKRESFKKACRRFFFESAVVVVVAVALFFFLLPSSTKRSLARTYPSAERFYLWKWLGLTVRQKPGLKNWALSEETCGSTATSEVVVLIITSLIRSRKNKKREAFPEQAAASSSKQSDVPL